MRRGKLALVFPGAAPLVESQVSTRHRIGCFRLVAA
jgi:hypothetical protein